MSESQAMFYVIGMYIVFLGLLFWNYGNFAATVVRWSKKPLQSKTSHKLKQPKLKVSEKLKCYIPIYQVCIVRKELYRSAGVFSVLSIISAIFITFNLINKFVFAINSYVMMVASILMIIGIVLFYIVYAIVTADCAKMFGFSWLVIILCFLAPWLFCWYLNNNVPTKIKAVRKEAQFSGNNTDTVIKQKHN